MLVTAAGEPVEGFLVPGADADVRSRHRCPFDLPTGSTVYADSIVDPSVKTTGSLIERLLPRGIHAVTAPGFELKVMLFALAVSMSPPCRWQRELISNPGM